MNVSAFQLGLRRLLQKRPTTIVAALLAGWQRLLQEGPATTTAAFQFGFRRRLPVVLQAEAAECGLACLAMILGYHGHPIDLATFRRHFSVSMKGVTLRDLIQIAGTMGLAARALRLEIADLGKLRRPCVLHWRMNHFVVLDDVSHNGITIHDPALGCRRIAMEEVSRSFTGVALEVALAQSFEKKDERRSLHLADLFRKAAGLVPALSRLFVLSFGIEVAGLLVPMGSQIILDEVIVAADRDLLVTVSVGLALLLVVQLVIAVARTWAIMLIGTTVNYQWSAGLFDHLSRLPLDFFEKRHVGDIISRFGSLGTIQKALTTDLVQAVLDGIMSVGTVIMMFVYGGWLGFVAIAATALNAILRAAAYRAYRHSTETSIVCDAKQQTHFIETVRGIASVKLLGLRQRRRSGWLNYLVDSLNAKLQLQRLDMVFGRASDFLFGADRVVMLVLGALAVISQSMTVGMLVAFLAYKDQFTQRISSLIPAWFQLQMLNLQSDRLADIVLAEPETDAASLPAPNIGAARSVGASLCAQGLSLRYGDKEPWVLRNINLDIASQCCVAIAGPSGCGKTTMLKVLMGLLSPTEGLLLVGGVDLRPTTLESYRSRIAGVLQDDRLFGGSIAENICGFDEGPDQGWMEECAARAAILDDIRRMPMGFETLVGDMGSTLSGGQRQRVVLARALYRRPEILFLDEATSHLDEPTEAVIATALRDLRMTRVVVAHRPATMAHADIIIPFASVNRPMAGIPEAEARPRAVG
jgi:ATP-binding cassette, subfamily B, bacterial CvaB/MchF/RaxB